MANPRNDRIRHRYLDYLRHTAGYSEKTIDAIMSAISDYERYTGYRDFRRIHPELVKAYKRHLLDRP